MIPHEAQSVKTLLYWLFEPLLTWEYCKSKSCFSFLSSSHIVHQWNIITGYQECFHKHKHLHLYINPIPILENETRSAIQSYLFFNVILIFPFSLHFLYLSLLLHYLLLIHRLLLSQAKTKLYNPDEGKCQTISSGQVWYITTANILFQLLECWHNLFQLHRKGCRQLNIMTD